MISLLPTLVYKHGVLFYRGPGSHVRGHNYLLEDYNQVGTEVNIEGVQLPIRWQVWK